jgi:hypothetical protein
MTLLGLPIKSLCSKEILQKHTSNSYNLLNIFRGLVAEFFMIGKSLTQNQTSLIINHLTNKYISQVIVPPPATTTEVSPSTDASVGATSPPNSIVPIIAGVIGGIVFIALIVVIVLLVVFLRRRRVDRVIISLSGGNNSIADLELRNSISLDRWKEIKDVTIGSTIGGGNFGTVFKGTWMKTPVALKTLADPRQFLAEAGILQYVFLKLNNDFRKLNHPNIVQYLGVFRENGSIFLVMEFMDRGDLSGYLHMNPNLSHRELLQM